MTNAQRNKRAILAIIGSVLVVAATIGGIRWTGVGESYYQQNAGNPQFVRGYNLGVNVRAWQHLAADPTSSALEEICLNGEPASINIWTKPLLNGYWYGCLGQENASGTANP
jgi:hypothetical protein